MAIYKKLLEFQKLGITVGKDGNNPHFKSRYTTLNEVLDKVKKPLNELGIVIIQAPEVNGVRTRLYDTYTKLNPNDPTEMEGGDFVECFVPFINPTDMQKLGGAITYGRRYGLITLLCLEDEDDDGNAASRPASGSAASAGDVHTSTDW